MHTFNHHYNMYSYPKNKKQPRDFKYFWTFFQPNLYTKLFIQILTHKHSRLNYFWRNIKPIYLSTRPAEDAGTLKLSEEKLLMSIVVLFSPQQFWSHIERRRGIFRERPTFTQTIRKKFWDLKLFTRWMNIYVHFFFFPPTSPTIF